MLRDLSMNQNQIGFNQGRFGTIEQLEKNSSLKMVSRASLVAQWLRVRLPMQGTQVRALVWEDPTCRGAAGPVSHNY